MNIGAVLDSIASAEISHASDRLELFRRDVYIPDPDGDDIRLSILDVHPDNPLGVIVLLHGFAASTKWWQPQIPALSRRYRVIAIDERGCGLSARPPSGYSFEQLADDTAAVLDQLGIDEPVVVGGHSTGGAVVIEFALRHPQRVARLIIVATPVSFADSSIVRSAGRVMKLPDFLFRWAQPFYELDPRGEASLLGLKHLFQNGLLTWDGHDKLPQVNHQTLFIRGERDRVFAHESYAEFVALMPNAELVEIGVSKHQIPLERPQAVVRLIERFLEPDEAVRKQPVWRRNVDGVAGLPLLATRPWVARYPESVPHNIDPVRISLSQMLAHTVRTNGHAVAWQFRRERTQYAEFDDQVRSVAAGLHAHGVRSGERVCMWLPNTPHFPIALYAVVHINAVAVLGDFDATLEQVGAQIQATGARWLITMDTVKDSAETLLTTANLEKIIYANFDDYGERRKERHKKSHSSKDAQEGLVATSHTVTWRDLALTEPEMQPQSLSDPDGTAIILFTPDTATRGIQLSHTNLVTAAVQMVDWTQTLDLQHGGIMSAVPFSTAIGLTLGVNLAVHAASRMDLFPEAETELFLKAMWLWKPTIIVSTPHVLKTIRQFRGLAQFVAPPGPVFLSTGAPLPVEGQEVFERLSHARVIECYGMSETAAITHCNPLQRNRAGSVGLPLPGVEVEVRDLRTGEPLSFLHVGELFVRGPQVMKGVMGGYLEPDGTGRVQLDDDGWLATGDLAEIDDDGYFHILGRCSAVHRTATGDLIIPRDVEEVVIELPEVSDVAVLSHADGLLACIVVAENGEISAETVREFCRERLPVNYVPADFRFVAQLPRNYAGRLLDDDLRLQLSAEAP